MNHKHVPDSNYADTVWATYMISVTSAIIAELGKLYFFKWMLIKNIFEIFWNCVYTYL